MDICIPIFSFFTCQFDLCDWKGTYTINIKYTTSFKMSLVTTNDILKLVVYCRRNQAIIRNIELVLLIN